MKRKLLFAIVALLCAVGMKAQPTASTPSVGNTYYLYNPLTKLFMTSAVNLPFVRPTGSAWKLEAAAGHDGWVTLRLKDNDTEGCGYFWGKWWANDPAGNSDSYSDERVYQLVNISENNYKLKSYAWGATDAYIYINTGNEGDRSFRLACNSQDQGGLDEGYITWQFISEEDYASYMENDYTSQIKNNDFTSGLGNWTVVATTGNRQAHGNTAVEYWNSTAAGGGFDYYQELTGLPAGKYVLRAAMYNSTNGETVNDTPVTFDPAGQCGVYGTSNEITKYANVTVDGTAYNIYTTEGLLVPDGNLRLGLKNSTTMTARWFGADWIQLSCVEYCLSVKAIALPGNGAMEADTWYYYDIPTSDDYEFTSTNATTLTYSEDGAQLFSEATGTEEAFTAAQKKEISLSAGRLYVKANAATTLAVSYKYNVGSATSDVAYIQSGNTVTVTWEDASSNDPGATLAKDFSGVTFNSVAVSCTPTAKGFTFTVPDGLVANTAYTLSIPASAIGYAAASLYNAAQNFTLTTPALFDGNYYFRVASTYNGSTTGTSAAVGKYLSRGNNYGTRTTVDVYGQAITVTTDGNNVSSLKMMDSHAYIYHANSWDSWADHGAIDASTAHTIILTDGVYRISSNQNTGKYFKYNNSTVNNEEITVYDDGTGANNGPIINWAVESVSEHATAMQNKKDNQAATAAASAYATGDYATLNGITTVSALESELTTNYIADDFVSAGAVTSVSESYEPRNGDEEGPKVVYSNTIDIEAPGFYRFSMQAFFRSSSNVNTQEVHTAGADMPGAALFFGSYETQIKSLYDEGSVSRYVDYDDWRADASYNGKYYANCTDAALKAFQDGQYHNDVWFYASEAGTYTYGVKVMGYAGSQWFIYSPQSVSVTSYSAAATSEDYVVLNAAISAGDSKVYGFEDGEFAPYNNITALEVLAATKLIDQEAPHSKIFVRDAAGTLNNAWVANEGEVNAIRWNIADYPDNNAETKVPTGGFVGSNSNSRISHKSADGGNTGLRGLDQWMALMVIANTNATYGETAGYTMPLKANTVYKLTFKYAGWGDLGTPTVKILNSSSEEVTSTTLAAPTKTGNDNTDAWIPASIIFKTSTAGNYKVQFITSDNRDAFGDLMLKKDALNDRTFSADKWNTLCVPFAFNKEDFAEVKELSAIAVDGDHVSMTLNDVSTIEAGKPYLVKAKNNGDKITVTNSGDYAAVQESSAKASGYTVNFVGTYEGTTVTAATADGNAFVVKNNGIYNVNSAVSVGAYRAYFTVEAETPVKALIFDFNELPTAINAVEAAQNEKAEIYNLAGQRLNKAQKGVNIINGKKVLVK